MRKVLAILLLCVQLSAQVNFPDKQFTTHDGLPQIQVTDLLQDQRGYIWIGTKKGVAFYNGETFSKIGHPVLDHGQIKFILEDSQGNLYFILPHPESTIYKYDGRVISQLQLGAYLNFRTFTLHNDHLFILKSKNEILEFNLGTLALIDKKVLDTDLRAIFKTEDNQLMGISQDQSMIIGINSGDTIKTQGNSKFQLNNQYRGKSFIREVTSSKHINKVKILSPDLNEYTLEFDEYTQRSYYKQRIKSLNNEQMLLQSLDTIFRITHEGVINKYKVSNTTRVIMLEDNDNNLWVSHENGLEFFADDMLTSYNKNVISDAWAINSINDKFYYCSYSKGIFEIDKSISTVKRLFPPAPDRHNYTSSVDKKNNIYFSGNHSLLRYNGKTFDDFPLPNGNPSLVNYYDTVNEQLVIGGRKNISILKGDSLQLQESPTDTCLSRFVVAITNKSEQEYWIGTYTEVVSYNHVDGTYTSHSNIMPADSTGAIALCVDNNNNLWIGNRHGLWYKDSNKDKAIPIAREAFTNEFVLALKELPNDILAIGTSNGFSILDMKEFTENGNAFLKNFNHRTAFKGEEVAQNGFFLKDSILFIPSSTYLSSIHISDLDFSAGGSDVLISSVNKQKIPWNRSGFDLTVNNNDITIDFGGVGFNEPFESRYSFILEGKDKIWSPWTTNNSIEYTDLTSGEYVFKVKKQTAIFNKDEELPSDNISFHIDVPIYKEPDFYKYAFIGLLLLGALFLGSLYFIYKNFYVRKQQEEKIKYLEIQALQSQLNPHFIFNVLGTIQGLVLNNQTEQANKYLVSFSKLIRRFLDSNVSNNPSSQDQLSKNQIALKEEIELLELYIEFELLQYADKFDYEINTSTVDILNLNIPPMIIQPFVENAIKHGLLHSQKKGILKVDFQETEDALVCIIDDNGIGRKKSQEIQARSPSMYKSQGTQLVLERIKLLNKPEEKITIETIDKLFPDEGTKVIIRFDKQDLL